LSGAIDVLTRKRIAIVASNPAVSPTTGWPIGFWWSELTHPYWVFAEHGYDVDVYSVTGGKLEADLWSDPRDESNYSEEDLISLGFINSPRHFALTQGSKPIRSLAAADHDAVLFIGGQAPMITFHQDQRVHRVASDFYESGKVTAALCHATCLLLNARTSKGGLIVEGKTWTGFANSEEDFADEFVGQKIQPFRIEDEAKKIPETNFIVAGRFKAHAVRDDNLITGQQQYSGTAAARLMVEALGV
jgi:putative intracellular protease/amidase